MCKHLGGKMKHAPHKMGKRRHALHECLLVVGGDTLRLHKSVCLIKGVSTILTSSAISPSPQASPPQSAPMIKQASSPQPNQVPMHMCR